MIHLVSTPQANPIYQLVNLEKLRDIESDRLNIIESLIPSLITRPFFEFSSKFSPPPPGSEPYQYEDMYGNTMYYLYGDESDTADYLTRKEVELIIKAKREHK
jgi:hypothetical protein